MAQQVETHVDDPLGTGSHDPPVPAELAAFMGRGWGQPPQDELRALAPAELCAARRARLTALLPGERLVIPAGRPARRGNGQDLPFRAASDFVYLTGNGSAGAVLVLEDGDAALYVDPPTGRDGLDFFQDYHRGDFWVGRRPEPAALEELLGIACRPLSELPSGRARHLDGEEFADRELRAILSELRLVKDAWELEQMALAVDAAILAYEDVARALPSARSERDIDVAFVGRARREGNGEAFNVIAAAGRHATTLHWIRNDGPLRDGELLLLDAGVESHTLYASDLTRTYPINGTHTEWQRRVLELLNDAHEAALAAVGPGRPFSDFRAASHAVLAAGLAEWGILPDGVAPEEAQRRFSICGPGHMLGLDVHDCANARAATYLEGTLQSGMVLTVEPGLYFQAEDLTVPEALRGVGARVEDDVVVTETGIRNLSERLPRRPDDVEEWLAAFR